MDNGGEFTQRLLEAAGIERGMRVLDVGCGVGLVSLRLAAMVGPEGRVVGLDRDAAALATARARAADQPHIQFVAGDLETADVPAGSFDAVVGRRVLMYLPDPARTLRVLRNLLRPGGIAVFQEHDSSLIDAAPLPPLHARVHDLIWRTVASEGADVHMGLALAPALRSAGFAIADVRVEATVLMPEFDHPIAAIVQAMQPRMLAAGLDAAATLGIDTLAARLAAERAASDATLIWETIFGMWASPA